MCERFVRIGIEIPLSLYANLDKIKNGSAASGRILDAIKKEKRGRTQTMKRRLIDAEALKAELTGRIALPDWVLTAVLHIIDNAPTVDITEEQAIDKLHETGWMQKHDKEMTARPTGKWIPKCVDYYDGLICSVCGELLPCSDEYHYDANYCPHCGAKMEVK